EAIELHWEPLPHAIGATAALSKNVPRVWSDKPGNLAFEVTLGNHAETVRAFNAAAQSVALTIINQRLVTNYLETRGVVAEYDAVHDRVTLTLASQGSHAIRDTLAADGLKS